MLRFLGLSGDLSVVDPYILIASSFSSSKASSMENLLLLRPNTVAIFKCRALRLRTKLVLFCLCLTFQIDSTAVGLALSALDTTNMLPCYVGNVSPVQVSGSFDGPAVLLELYVARLINLNHFIHRLIL